jgi:type II secretory pathway pseudopilin PulG
MVGITIMTILIAAVLPLASTEMQREKEAELIFRGRQYAEGIRVFRRKYGRFPTSLKEMADVRPRTLRKLWKDPITNSDQWGLISTLTGAPAPGQNTSTGLPNSGGGTTSPFRTPSVFGGEQGAGATYGGTSATGGSSFGGGSGFGNTFGGSGGRGAQPTPVPTPTPTGGDSLSPFADRSGSLGQPPSIGPVAGVYSLAQKKALRLYEGRDSYNEWRFTEQSLGFSSQPDLGGAPPVAPGPGGQGGAPKPPGGGTGGTTPPK